MMNFIEEDEVQKGEETNSPSGTAQGKEQFCPTPGQLVILTDGPSLISFDNT